MKNEHRRIETPAPAKQRLKFVRPIQMYRRTTRKLFYIMDLLPRGIGIASAILFLGLTVTYGVMLGGKGTAVSDSLATASGFAIKTIKISGQREITESQVLDALSIGPNSSLLLYAARDAKERITQLPWVQSVSVQKFYPNTLSIEIEEKEPFALWQNGDIVSIIDEKGETVTDSIDERFINLPLLVGHGAQFNAKEILAPVENFPEIKSRIRAYKFVSGRRWDLIAKDGMTMRLPETNYLDSLKTIDELNRKADLFSRDLAVIDLRIHDRIVVRLNNNLEDAESSNNNKKIEVNTEKVEL